MVLDKSKIIRTTLHPVGDPKCEGTHPCHLCNALTMAITMAMPISELLAVVFVRGGIDTDIRVCEEHREQLEEHGKIAGRTFDRCKGAS